ncbi:MAG: SRPBCC family protein [Acidimicrobiia bacterium]
MKISQEFEVQRPVDDVWAFFQEVPAVAQCLPGAELTEDKGGGAYAGKVSVKLGPITAAFEGEAVVEPDASSSSGHMEGKGVDRRGGSRGRVGVDYRLRPSEAGTKVMVDADVVLSGPAAQFGRIGLIEEMSRRLIGQFVECLEAKLAAPTAEEAASIHTGELRGLSLFFSSLRGAVGAVSRRLFKRG